MISIILGMYLGMAIGLAVCGIIKLFMPSVPYRSTRRDKQMKEVKIRCYLGDVDIRICVLESGKLLYEVKVSQSMNVINKGYGKNIIEAFDNLDAELDDITLGTDKTKKENKK